MLLPVYITIGNLDIMTWRSQTRVGTLLLSSIFVIHKRSKDGKNKDKDLKIKIYHLALIIMLERKYLSSICR